MAKFFVGQRVRVISCDDPHPENVGIVGMEGVVHSLDVVNEWDEGGNVGVVIEGDDSWCFWPHELAPILDQHQPCDAEFKQSLDDLLKRTERTNIRI